MRFFDIQCPTLPNFDRTMGFSSSLELSESLYKGFRKNGIIVVSKSSDIRIKKATERIALFFQRERGYDFVQYRADEWSRVRYHRPQGESRERRETDETLRAFLWYDLSQESLGEERVSVIGAICFRKKIRTQPKRPWRLEWVWLHPYSRRKGILKKSWSLFKMMFGPFDVIGPCSEGMEKFLLSVDGK